MTQITADQQRCGKQTPKADMGILFIGREMRIVLARTPPYLADDQHVGIVEMSGIGILRYRRLTKPDVVHAFPGIGNIARGSPALENNEVVTPVILDCVHCDYAAARLAYRLKKNKFILI